MPINLKKGQKVALSTLKGSDSFVVGLGWSAGGNESFDCDASAFLLTDGKLKVKEDIVSLVSLKHRSGSVIHTGDDMTGGDNGDCEQIRVLLEMVPPQYDRIVFVVNIYRALFTGQHFGMIDNAYIRIVDERTSDEVVRFNLTDDYSGMTAMIVGQLVRVDNSWSFIAIGEGTGDDSINQLADRFF